MLCGLEQGLLDCSILEADGEIPQPGVNCDGYGVHVDPPDHQWDWCVNLDPADAQPGVNCVDDPITAPEEPYTGFEPRETSVPGVQRRPYGPALPPKKQAIQGVDNKYLIWGGLGLVGFLLFQKLQG